MLRILRALMHFSAMLLYFGRINDSKNRSAVSALRFFLQCRPNYC
jgi:hypothetical protein